MVKIKPKHWFLSIIIVFMIVTTMGKAFLQPFTDISHQGHAIKIVESLKDVLSWNHSVKYVTFGFGKRYMPIWGLKLLEIITLLPMGVAAILSWRNVVTFGTAISWEIRKFFVIFGSMLLGYGSLLYSVNSGCISKFHRELLANHKVNVHPDILSLLVILIVMALGYFALRFILHTGDGVYPSTGTAFYLTIILFLASLLILTQITLTEYMLLMPILIFWPLISPAKFLGKQLANLVWVVITFGYYLFVVVYSFIQISTGKIISAVASGYLHPATILLLTALFTIHIRMITIAVHPPEAHQSQLKFSALGRSKYY